MAERRSVVARALTIAGSDPGGGAGIQADLKTFAALGVWGMSAVTAVTVQNTLGVEGFAEIPPDIVAAQIHAVAGDIGVDGAKTGMLASAPIIEAVARALREAAITRLVVDPVSVSKHGDPLLRPAALDALRSGIVPLAAVVTPNLPEAEALVGFPVRSREDMRRAAGALLDLGARSALVKGGHLAEDLAADLFADGEGEAWLESQRLDTANTHGTGCVLSAAIAAHMALGRPVREAVRLGKAFVTEAIRHALPIGGGVGPVDPGWRRLGLDR